MYQKSRLYHTTAIRSKQTQTILSTPCWTQCPGALSFMQTQHQKNGNTSHRTKVHTGVANMGHGQHGAQRTSNMYRRRPRPFVQVTALRLRACARVIQSCSGGGRSNLASAARQLTENMLDTHALLAASAPYARVSTARGAARSAPFATLTLMKGALVGRRVRVRRDQSQRNRLCFFADSNRRN